VVKTIDIDTPSGQARAHLHAVKQPRAALVIGHGAGGGVDAPDIQVAMAVANAHGVSVALVEQPYRVAGRRSPAPAPKLDAAWIAVIEALQKKVLKDLPLIVGGRSSGARVACRTAPMTNPIGVLCLAFPLVPPQRAGKPPGASRLPELKAVTAPVLIVQGERDPFGMPKSAGSRTVTRVPGDHSLKKDLDAVRAAIDTWLTDLLAHAAP
jgi:predicted alpha/beta-hydrolase family hydrolase